MEHVHFVGIGGTGLSAIARVLLERGYRVSGSDRKFSTLARSIESAGATVFLGHHPDQINGADMVVRSSAIPEDNVEVQAAISNGIPVLKRSDFLEKLVADKKTVAIAGTHGKTSTTAMIIWILSMLSQDPSFIVGGQIPDLGTNARSGEGPLFVIEADEYDRMFLGLNPMIEVITNVEHDHPDCYPTLEDFRAAFRDFVCRLEPDGMLLACGDHNNTAEMIDLAVKNGNLALTYGVDNLKAQYRAIDLKPNPDGGGYSFQLVVPGEKYTNVTLQVPGIHNVQNAVAALAVADLVGLSLSESAKALSAFRGVGRRFELIGESGGISVVSDYAHHPTEIKATLNAARTRFPNRGIWAVWQPHTYSRTRLMLSAFTESFEDAHHLLVLEIFPSREPVELDFSSRQIVERISHPHAEFISGCEECVDYLLGKLISGDVLMVLSAGDADQICTKVLAKLDSKTQGDKRE